MTGPPFVHGRDRLRVHPIAPCQCGEQKGGLVIVAPLRRPDRLGNAAGQGPEAGLGVRHRYSADPGGERRGQPVGTAPPPRHGARARARPQGEVRTARDDRGRQAGDYLRWVLSVAVERDDDARAALERRRNAGRECGAFPAIPWMNQYRRPLPPPPLDAIPRPVLGRIKEAELALPVPQHVRLEIGELADLADREELLYRMRRAHLPPPPPPPHCSGFSSRSIKSTRARWGDLPSN